MSKPDSRRFFRRIETGYNPIVEPYKSFVKKSCRNLFTASVFLLASEAIALEITSSPEGFVSDYAGMLSAGSRARLEEKLRQFEAVTSNQVVVATFQSLKGQALEDFSIRLAKAWKIGQKEKDNGVILLVFKEERQVRIEVGYGLEGALPDATSKLIIENEIIPCFRAGKFEEGVEGAVAAIMAATKGEYLSGVSRSQKNEETWITILLFSLFVAPLLIFTFVCIRIDRKTAERQRHSKKQKKRQKPSGDRREVTDAVSSERGSSDDDSRSFSGGGGGFGGAGASGAW